MRLGLEQGVEMEVLRYRVPFVVLAVLLLFLLVLFPFSVSSALVDLQSTDGALFPIQSVVVPEGPLAPNRA